MTRRARLFGVGVLVWVTATGAAVADRAGVARAQEPAAPPSVTQSGLELTLVDLRRTDSSALSDCPAGANTVKGVARPGQEYAVAEVRIRVLPEYAGAPVRPIAIHDADGKAYMTAMAILNPGDRKEFTCSFPFGIQKGTGLTRLQFGDASFDLAGLPAAK